MTVVVFVLALLTGTTGVAAVDIAVTAIGWAIKARRAIKIVVELAPHVHEVLDEVGEAIVGRPLTEAEKDIAKASTTRMIQNMTGPMDFP